MPCFDQLELDTVQFLPHLRTLKRSWSELTMCRNDIYKSGDHLEPFTKKPYFSVKADDECF